MRSRGRSVAVVAERVEVIGPEPPADGTADPGACRAGVWRCGGDGASSGEAQSRDGPSPVGAVPHRVVPVRNGLGWVEPVQEEAAH